jgi:hypothetical protein
VYPVCFAAKPQGFSSPQGQVPKCQRQAIAFLVNSAPKDLDKDEHERFFNESYAFLCKKYGEKNVVSAWVHMDETSPHMHFAFVPVVIDKKKGHEKISAKEALGWSEKGLHKFHRELDSHMTAEFGRDIGILNETTRDGNKTVQELKRETVISNAKKELEVVKRPVDGRIAHEKRINRLEDGIKEKIIPFTKKTKVVITVEDMTAEEAKTVFAAARDRDSMRVRRDTAIKERDSAFEERDSAVSEKNDAVEKLEGVEQRERAVKKAEEQATQKQAAADELYNQQANLNESYSQAVTVRDKYKVDYEESQKTIEGLKNQVATLQRERNTANNSLQRTENALRKGIDCFTFTKEGNKIMVGCDFNAFLDAVKGEKPNHRVLERCRERERELNRLLNRELSL